MQYLQSRKEIVAYSLDEFVKEIERSFIQGYKLDFETNKNYPLQLGPSMFICAMTPRVEAPQVDVSVVVHQNDERQMEPDLEPAVELEGEARVEVQIEPQEVQQVEPEVKQPKPRRVLKK